MLYFKFKCKSFSGNLSLRKKKKTLWEMLAERLYKMLLANPDFDDKLRYVAQWYLEYDEEYNSSWREIGLDINQKIIVKMPDERNYGFWLDTNCTIEDFDKDFGIQMVTEQEFNNLWNSVCYDWETKEFKQTHNDTLPSECCQKNYE